MTGFAVVANCVFVQQELRSLGFDSDLMSEIEELNRDFARQHPIGVRRRRTKAEMTDPVKSANWSRTVTELDTQRAATKLMDPRRR